MPPAGESPSPSHILPYPDLTFLLLYPEREFLSSVDFFRCSDLILPLPCPGGEFTSSVTFFLCLDLFLTLPYLGSECTSLCHFLSVS